MSDFKPSRATVDIVGTVGRVESKFDGKLTEVTIAVNKGYKDKTTQQWVDTGTDWYTHITRGDWQQQVHDLALQPGDRVEVTQAKLEHREYEKRDGKPGIACDLNFGELTVLERKADRDGGGGQGSESSGFGSTSF